MNDVVSILDERDKILLNNNKLNYTIRISYINKLLLELIKDDFKLKTLDNAIKLVILSLPILLSSNKDFGEWLSCKLTNIESFKSKYQLIPILRGHFSKLYNYEIRTIVANEEMGTPMLRVSLEHSLLAATHSVCDFESRNRQ
jgi:hypothetical protein